MNRVLAIGWCMAACLPGIALAASKSDAKPPVQADAKPPVQTDAKPAAQVDAKALAQVEAIRDFCTELDPQAMKDAPDVAGAMVGQMSPEDRKKTRESEDYLQAYNAISLQLARADPAEAQKSCSGAARPGR